VTRAYRDELRYGRYRHASYGAIVRYAAYATMLRRIRHDMLRYCLFATMPLLRCCCRYAASLPNRHAPIRVEYATRRHERYIRHYSRLLLTRQYTPRQYVTLLRVLNEKMSGVDTTDAL